MLRSLSSALISREEEQEGGPQGGVDRLGVVLLHLGPGWVGLAQDSGHKRTSCRSRTDRRTAARIAGCSPAAGAGVDACLEAPGETVPAEVVAAGGRHLGRGLQGQDSLGVVN